MNGWIIAAFLIGGGLGISVGFAVGWALRYLTLQGATTHG